MKIKTVQDRFSNIFFSASGLLVATKVTRAGRSVNISKQFRILRVKEALTGGV
jgi:hypothetical protein